MTVLSIEVLLNVVLKIHLEYAKLPNKTTQLIKMYGLYEYTCANKIMSCVRMGVLREIIT